MGALSFGLALPLSFAFCVCAQAETASVESLAAASDGLQQWRDYALQSITPEFSFSETSRKVSAPTLFGRSFGLDSHTQLAQFRNGRSGLSLDIMSSFVGGVGNTDRAATSGQFRDDGLPGLHRTLVSPAYSQRIGEHGVWSVAAVLAYQRFASGDLGSVQWNSFGPPASVPGGDEVSYGRGVRVDYSAGLSDHLSWDFGYQSRVNMDTFNNFRGIFGDPGDFDIPASASAGLSIGASSPISLNFGIERVMYSSIRPFTSAALPRRVLAVLGDGTSPVFAWRDLTVYSLGTTWSDHQSNQVSLRYTTREQPSPTSHLLEQLLADEQSRYGVELSYIKAISSASRFELSANYSPFQYVLGAPTSYSVRHDNSGNQIEFEALWTVAF